MHYFVHILVKNFLSGPVIYIVMYIMYSPITFFTSRPFEALTLFEFSAFVSDVSVSEQILCVQFILSHYLIYQNPGNNRLQFFITLCNLIHAFFPACMECV